MSNWYRREVQVSSVEQATARLAPAAARQAELLLHTRGYVILRNAVPAAAMQAAQAQFQAVLADCFASRVGDDWYQVSREHQAVFWQRGDRWRVFPKLRGPLGDRWVVANPLAMELVEKLLGDDCFCKFVSSDTCVRGSGLQSPHRELGCGGHTQPLAYIVNLPLVPCGLHNGPLEIWPGGTHLWHNDVLARLALDADVQDGRNPEIEALAADLPSIQVELQPGDLLIRDPGLLHRGTPNPTDEPRSMLTACFFRRGHAWDYGQAEYNVDAATRAKLDPAVRKYFDAAPPPSPGVAPSGQGTRPKMWRWLSSSVLRKSA